MQEKEKELTRTQRYYQENKARFRANRQRSRRNNREHVRRQAAEGERRRYKEDPQARAKKNASSKLRYCIVSGSWTPWVERHLGCDRAMFIHHIESLFVDEMSWENRGRHGWHFDHMEPLANFDLTDPSQAMVAFHYTNVQPLWANDNRTKATN